MFSSIRAGLVDFGKLHADAAALLAEVGLDVSPRARVETLGVAQMQLLEIAKALSTRSQVLVLDEPTEGIQPSIIKDIGRVSRMLADRGDMAILLVEHYYDFARSLADRYVVLSRGEVIKAGKGADMDADGVRACLTV